MLAGVLVAWLLARREASRPALAIHLSGDAPARIDGVEVDGFHVDWRGPLVTLAWTAGGRRVRRLAFPDALPASDRRELRLGALRRREDAPAAAVAP